MTAKSPSNLGGKHLKKFGLWGILISFVISIVFVSFSSGNIGTLHGAALYPDEKRFVKSACGSEIYLLQKEGLRLITPEVGKILFEENWPKQSISKVITLNCNFFNSLKVATPLSEVNYQAAKSEGTPKPVESAKPVKTETSPMEPVIQPAPPIISENSSKIDEPLSAAIPDSEVTDHPRLWFTKDDIPKLRSWANMQNPVYANGTYPALQEAIQDYQLFYPGGKENTVWPDPGNITWQTYTTERIALIFAFHSIVDQNPIKRDEYAQMSKNLFMHIMNEAVKGPTKDEQPFRHEMFSGYDRARTYGESFGLVFDMLQYHPKLLSANDIETTRKVFMRWAEEGRRQGRSNIPNLRNNPQLINGRMVGNNYYSGVLRNMAYLALSIDAEFDPPVDPSQPASKVGNTLRSYIGDITGAYVYQLYGFYGDPKKVSQEYGIPMSTPHLGVGSGGIPTEGPLYGNSIGYNAQTLLALMNAGYGDPKIYGPGMNFITSDYWDKFINGIYHSVAPKSYIPTGSWASLGPVYEWAAYGDMLRSYLTPDYINALAPTALIKEKLGDESSADSARWIARNMLAGGKEKFYERMKDTNWSGSQAILYFLLFDPNSGAEVDPRPAMPDHFISTAFGRLFARTGWSTNASWFTFFANWIDIDHQHAMGGSNFYRNGEWLTRTLSNYDNEGKGQTTDYQNTLSLENKVPSNLFWFENEISKRGSQWEQGFYEGDPTFIASVGKNSAYAFSDLTKSYNKINTATDISHASRSILWIKPDYVVIYDRATSKSPGMFKRFNLNFIGAPNINGKTASSTTAGGQKFFVESLLPANASLSVIQHEIMKPIAELETTTHRLVIEDKNKPKDVRFLTVLQGADPGAAQTTTQLVKSTSGTQFEGGYVGTIAAVFPQDVKQSFTTTTFTVPGNLSKLFIGDLTPNKKYDISTQKVGNGTQITIAPGTGYQADSAGLLEM